MAEIFTAQNTEDGEINMETLGLNTDYLQSLKNLINNGTKIILIDYPDVGLIKIFDYVAREHNTTNLEIWQSIEETLISDRLKFIPKEELSKIISLYCMYDFSDKVSLVSDCSQYGSMFNYVNNGILTNNEMVDAIFSKI